MPFQAVAVPAQAIAQVQAGLAGVGARFRVQRAGWQQLSGQTAQMPGRSHLAATYADGLAVTSLDREGRGWP